MKHGAGRVLVWGCVSVSGVGSIVFIKGIMDKLYYLDILKWNRKQSAEKLGLANKFYFQHDNDHEHIAYIVRQWIAFNIAHLLHTPP